MFYEPESLQVQSHFNEEAKEVLNYILILYSLKDNKNILLVSAYMVIILKEVPKIESEIKKELDQLACHLDNGIVECENHYRILMEKSEQYHLWKHNVATRFLIDEENFREFLSTQIIGEEETTRKFIVMREHLNEIMTFYFLNSHTKKCGISCENPNHILCGELKIYVEDRF